MAQTQVKRREKKEVEVDLIPVAAKKLVKQVFKLQDKLNISNNQMSEDSGLTIEQLYRLRCTWMTCRARQPKQLLKKFANGLIMFWNAHLETEPAKPGRKRAIKLSPETTLIFKILIEEKGVGKARTMLVQKGKGNLFDQYLRELSTEQLLELLSSAPKIIFPILLAKEGLKRTSSLMGAKGQAMLFEKCLREFPSKKLVDLV